MSAMSHPVPVVPTFAPKTRPSPCGNVRSPALTRPIVVIVTALDDCTRSVTIAPQNAPESGVAAALASTVRNAEPASAFSPSVMTVMPSRKSPIPPKTEIAVAMPASLRLLFRLELGARGGEVFLLVRGHLRVLEVELLHRLDDRSRDNEAGEPLVVGGHDEPRRVLRSGRSDGLIVRAHVVVPVAAFAHVGSGEFPVLLRLVEALHEALLLLLAGQVEVELEDDHALPGEIVLEPRDVGEPLVPDSLADKLWRQLLRLEQLLVDAHHEHFLVVRAIEDGDAPALRSLHGVSPKEIVRQLLLGGLLERKDVTALRIDARQDVLDRAILSGSVHRLEHQQHRPGILRVEDILLHREPFRAAPERLGRFSLVQLQPQRIAGIEVFQAKVLALRNAVRICVFPDRVEDIVARQNSLPLWLSSNCHVASVRAQCQLCAAASVDCLIHRESSFETRCFAWRSEPPCSIWPRQRWLAARRSL